MNRRLQADTGLPPLAVRAWHALNAVGFVLLILTGLYIRYADLLAPVSFETAVQAHNLTGFVVIANWLFWLAYHLATGRIAHYLPGLGPGGLWRGLGRQLRYYGYGMFADEDPPWRERAGNPFNSLQKLAYSLVMLFVAPCAFLTGLMLWDVDFFAGLIRLAGGIRMVSTLHVLLLVLLLFYVLMHAYMGTLGPRRWTRFAEMFLGRSDPTD